MRIFLVWLLDVHLLSGEKTLRLEKHRLLLFGLVVVVCEHVGRLVSVLGHLG